MKKKVVSKPMKRRHLRRGHTRLSVMQIAEVVRRCTASAIGPDVVEVFPFQFDTTPYRFSLRKIEQYGNKIGSMLSCINPKMNRADGGHPLPWIFAVTDRWDKRWTKYLSSVDALLALGRAAGLVKQVTIDTCDNGDDVQILNAAQDSGIPCVVLERVRFKESGWTTSRLNAERRKRAERRAAARRANVKNDSKKSEKREKNEKL